MPTIPFTVTVQSTPSIQVSGVNVAYDTLLNSFGSFWYALDTLYLETFTIGQANEPIAFNRYDSDGQRKGVIVTPAIDPYGKQAALWIDISSEKFVIDSRLIITPTILPLSAIRYTFYTRRGYLSEKLNLLGVPNKKLIENV